MNCYAITSNGIQLKNERGSLDLSYEQLAVIYRYGKREYESHECVQNLVGGPTTEQEVKLLEAENERLSGLIRQLEQHSQTVADLAGIPKGKSCFSADNVETVLSRLATDLKALKDAAALETNTQQGYDPMREVMELKGRLIDAEHRELEARTHGLNLEAELKRTKMDLETMTRALQIEKDSHTATKHEMGEFQKAVDLFKEFKTSINTLWERR